METIENLAKLYNLTTDNTIRLLMEWTMENENLRNRFEAFLKTKTTAIVDLKQSELKEAYLFTDVFNKLKIWAKNNSMTVNEALNLLVSSFLSMSDETSNFVIDSSIAQTKLPA